MHNTSLKFLSQFNCLQLLWEQFDMNNENCQYLSRKCMQNMHPSSMDFYIPIWSMSSFIDFSIPKIIFVVIKIIWHASAHEQTNKVWGKRLINLNWEITKKKKNIWINKREKLILKEAKKFKTVDTDKCIIFFGCGLAGCLFWQLMRRRRRN